MLLIHKGNEPPSLTTYRKSSHAYYDGCKKDDIRANLVKEQGYLCAYCMRRISGGITDTRIEHWKPRSSLLTELEKLDYSNMLAVCRGHKEGMPGTTDTCDAKKGEDIITLDPRRPDHIAAIGYKKGTGEIISANQKHNQEINENLNLNCAQHLLAINRKATLQQFTKTLRKKQSLTSLKIQKLIEFYDNPDSNGRKKEYAGIILWYLKKRSGIQ